MPLQFQDGQSFVSGACQFRDALLGQSDLTPKIYIDIEIDGFTTEAVVDTGGVYLVLNPGLIDVDPGEALEAARVVVRGYPYDGYLYRVTFNIPADQGAGLQVDATAFVPKLKAYESWPLPNFLGWQGCLERFRLALDPRQNSFYFGPV